MSAVIDLVFSLPAAGALFLGALLVAAWPRTGWTPRDYGLAVGSIMFGLAALGGGILILRTAYLGLVFLGPPYVVACSLAIPLSYASARAIAEVNRARVRLTPALVPRVLGYLPRTGPVFGWPGGAVLFPWCLVVAAVVIRTDSLYVGVPILPFVAGLGVAAVVLLVLALPPRGARGWLTVMAGFLAVSASLCLVPSTVERARLTSALRDLPQQPGSSTLSSGITVLSGTVDRTWQIEAPLGETARWYDDALRKDGWDGYWVRDLHGVNGYFTKQDPSHELTLAIEGTRRVPDIEPPKGLEAILTSVSADPDHLTVRAYLRLQSPHL